MSIDYQHRKFGGIIQQVYRLSIPYQEKKKKDATSAAKLDNLLDFAVKITAEDKDSLAL